MVGAKDLKIINFCFLETQKKNKKRVSQSNMIEYLSAKHIDSLKCKEKQHALEEKKLEL